MHSNQYGGPRDKCWGVEIWDDKTKDWYLNYLYWVGNDDDKRVKETVDGNFKHGVKIRMARWDRVGEYITAEE